MEADYNGRTPPDRLFDDLAMIGWVPPAPVPPPKAAIDWDVPDVERGTRFSVRDYEVTGAVVAAPAGSGRRGSWTDGERAAYVQTLEGVLARHGVSLGSERPPPPPPPPPVVAAPAAPAPPPPISRPEPPVVADAAPAVATDDLVCLTVVLQAFAVAPAHVVLQRLGVTFRTDTTAREKAENYRSTRTTSVVQVPCVRAVLTTTECEQVIAALIADGVIVDRDAAVIEAQRLETLASFLDAPTAASRSSVDPALATVTIVVTPLRRDLLAEALDVFAVGAIEWGAGSLQAATNYRGSVSSVSRRAVQAIVGVRPDAVPALLDALRAFGVVVDDPAQVRIDAAAPSPPSTPMSPAAEPPIGLAGLPPQPAAERRAVVPTSR